jgi:hypothetical protein
MLNLANEKSTSSSFDLVWSLMDIITNFVSFFPSVLYFLLILAYYFGYFYSASGHSILGTVTLQVSIRA